MSKLEKNEKNGWKYQDSEFEELVSETTQLIPVAHVVVGDQMKTGHKFTKVEKKEDCPSQWRTHVHINKSNCYDGRSLVRVK